MAREDYQFRPRARVIRPVCTFSLNVWEARPRRRGCAAGGPVGARALRQESAARAARRGLSLCPVTPPPARGTPRPRAALAEVPAYVAGRPPAVREGMQTYKLSSNEVPFPPLPEVLEAATTAAAAMNRYPDMGSVALYERLSDRLGVPVDQLAVGTGSVALLYHLIQAFCEPGDEVVYAWRSFEAYPIATAVAGARAVQ